ncbi:hypothetical protein A1O1_00265 [Capronia coronata CBS 617.96]|uniref:Kinetochore protein fta4 n=1 Tax=Capronia coronata CBS 617.96 TaxID=1182541 RepID=W9Z0P8_9EURO|nr:uncharacterized protein A1O1_00265 [Capronia coronata CBS 617.96]EXJ95146.1 hypothetical protein A1O1_00265 [Capronia coronata CBS 617.96]
MDDHSQSITALKSAFIRSQVRHLSTPLEASTPWREFATRVGNEGGGVGSHLSDKVIEHIVSKVNEKIKHHNRMLYSQQSQRHVAEQIETLYWNILSTERQRAEEQERENELEPDAVVIRAETDLTDTNAIEDLLPEQYDELFLRPDQQREDETVDQDTIYTDLRAELLELSHERDALREKAARYRHLRKMLAPLEEPQTNVQPNLVTRDGELAKELDRMRILLARVTGRIGEMKNISGTRVEETQSENTSRLISGQTDRQKLAMVMDMDMT